MDKVSEKLFKIVKAQQAILKKIAQGRQLQAHEIYDALEGHPAKPWLKAADLSKQGEVVLHFDIPVSESPVSQTEILNDACTTVAKAFNVKCTHKVTYKQASAKSSLLKKASVDALKSEIASLLEIQPGSISIFPVSVGKIKALSIELATSEDVAKAELNQDKLKQIVQSHVEFKGYIVAVSMSGSKETAFSFAV